MADIVTSQTFVDGEKGITAQKLNNIVGQSVIQPDFYLGKAASSTMDATDTLLELKSNNTYAKVNGSQIITSVANQLVLADTVNNGMLRKVSGNATDYIDGTNNSHPLPIRGFISKTAAYTLVSADSGQYVICSGGSWTLTLPAPALGLIYTLRNDMGISGTTGTITVQTTGGTIDGAASLALLPQQECQLRCDGTNWRTFGLKREVILGTVDISSATPSGVVLLPVGYRFFVLDMTGLVGSTAGAYQTFVFSNNGGTTFDTAGNYREGYQYDTSNTAVGYSWIGGQTFGTFSWTTDNAGESTLKIYPGTATSAATWQGSLSGYTISVTRVRNALSAGYWNGTGPANALRWNQSSGNLTSMFLTVKGVV